MINPLVSQPLNTTVQHSFHVKLCVLVGSILDLASGLFPAAKKCIMNLGKIV